MATQAGPVVLSPESRYSAAGYGRLASSRTVLFAVLIVGLTLLFGFALAASAHSTRLLAAIGAVMLILPLVWAYPILGVYLAVAGALTFETFGLGFPDSITDRVPFFGSLSSLGGAGALGFNPGELLMISALAMVVVRRVADRERPLELGPMFGAIALYSFIVLLGFVRGVGSGGEAQIALTEVRSQIYLLVAYLLAFNLIREKAQLKRVMWIFLIAVAVKGVLGTWRYLVTLGGDLDRISSFTSYNSLLAHEESIFFGLFFLFVLLLFLFRAEKRQLKFGLLLLAPVLLAFLANERRAGMLAFFIGLLVVGVMVHVLVRYRRRLIRNVAILALLIVPMYVAAFGNGSGLISEPARAITSLYRPDQRDASSDEYRRLETIDLQYTISLSPVVGRGYGKPFEPLVVLPALGSKCPLCYVIPHNTILWIWMRVGFIGFAAFWFMAGRSVVQAGFAAKETKDPYLQSVAVLAIVAIFAWLAMGAVDMGIQDFREGVLIGVLIALVSRMSSLPQGEEATRREAAVLERRKAAKVATTVL